MYDRWEASFCNQAYMTIKLNYRFIAERIYKAIFEKDFTDARLLQANNGRFSPQSRRQEK